MLAVCVLQLAVSPVGLLRARLPGMSDALWLCMMAVLSSTTVFGGALVGRRLFKGAETHDFKKETQSRASLLDDCLLVIAGAALCMAGNIVTPIVERAAGRAGIEFRGGPEQTAPQSLPGLLLTLLAVGVLPAVTEELLLRGVLLPPLRRFGDGFAAACTAALFALLHQNMEQAPMAFVSGLALGWVYLRGGKLALPVLVHLWNNAASVLLMLLPGRAANVYALGLGLAGAVCLIILFLRRSKDNKGIVCGLSPGKRAVNFFFGSAAMAPALGYFAAMIALNTKISGG